MAGEYQKAEKTYKIAVTETLRRTFEIEANSAEEAEEQLFSDYPWSDEAPDISVDKIEEEEQNDED